MLSGFCCLLSLQLRLELSQSALRAITQGRRPSRALPLGPLSVLHASSLLAGAGHSGRSVLVSLSMPNGGLSMPEGYPYAGPLSHAAGVNIQAAIVDTNLAPRHQPLSWTSMLLSDLQLFDGTLLQLLSEHAAV